VSTLIYTFRKEIQILWRAKPPNFEVISRTLSIVSLLIDIFYNLRDHDKVARREALTVWRDGGIMSQHQQAFRPDISNDVSRIALHALAVLVADRGPAPSRNAQASADQLCGMLYNAVLSPDRAQMTQKVQDIRGLGVSNHEIKTVLVPAIARLLGENWLEDRASFGDVTVGCARLQSVVRHLETASEAAHIHPANRQAPRNCLVVVPQGEQHTLGAIVVMDQLRTAGAQATLALDTDAATVARLVRDQHFHAVMISASAGEDVEKLRVLVKNSQQNGTKPKVFVGGSIAQERSDLAIVTGSDYVSCDIREALDLCRPDRRRD